MPESPGNYQRIPNSTPSIENVSWKKFFVIVVGTANGAHRPIVKEFKRGGQTEVMSPEQCDYLLVFCPVASRVGTDISEALDHIPAGKPAVLVVMHHTFNRHHVIAPSSRLVQNPNILLTVDCLFHENKLLSCDLNDQMWHEFSNFFQVSQHFLCRIFSRCMMNTPMLISLGILTALLGVAFIVLISIFVMKMLHL